MILLLMHSSVSFKDGLGIAMVRQRPSNPGLPFLQVAWPTTGNVNIMMFTLIHTLAFVA